VSDSGLHPSPRWARLFVLAVLTAGYYTTERLTKPYSGQLRRIRAPSVSTGNHCQVTQGFKCLFSKDFISAFYILSISAMSFFAVIPYIFKQNSYDFCQTFNSL
jgi:hypothetical protein